jgi:hypothetical protein
VENKSNTVVESLAITGGTIPIRKGMESALKDLQKTVSLLDEIRTLWEKSNTTKEEEKIRYKVDSVWGEVKQTLVNAKLIVQKNGDQVLGKEIGQFLFRAQTIYSIACEQSWKQKDHPKIMDLLKRFQNQINDMQTKLYELN